MRGSLLFVPLLVLAAGCLPRVQPGGIEAVHGVCDLCAFPEAVVVKATVVDWNAHTTDLVVEDALLETTALRLEVTEVLRGSISPGQVEVHVPWAVDAGGTAVCGDLMAAKTSAVFVTMRQVEGHWLLGRQTMFRPGEGGLHNNGNYAREPLPEAELRAASAHASVESCAAAGLDASGL